MKHNMIDDMPVVFNATEIRDAYYSHIEPERPQSLYIADEDDEGNEIPPCLIASGTDCDGTYGLDVIRADRVAGWFGYEHGQFVLAVPSEKIDSEYPPLGAYAIVCTGKLKDEEPTPEPKADPTAGMKLWRVTAQQVCWETIYVWAKTLEEARDAAREDLGNDGVHFWEFDDSIETDIYEGEPNDPDSAWLADPEEHKYNNYIVKDGQLADLDD